MQLGLVDGLALLRGKASGIGQACVLGDDAFGDAQSRCYSLMGEFAHVFKTQHSPGLPGESNDFQHQVLPAHDLIDGH